MITLLQWPCSISPSRNQTPGAMRRMVSGAASERATNRATAASETNPVSKQVLFRSMGHPLSGLLYTIPRPIRAATVRERLISECGCRIRSLTVAALIGVQLRKAGHPAPHALRWPERDEIGGGSNLGRRRPLGGAHGGVSRGDPRRVRFLPGESLPDRYRAGVSQDRRGDDFHHDGDSGVPSGGRVFVRSAGGPLRAAAAADARPGVLLGGGSALRPRAQLRHLPVAARAFRNWHGRGVGDWGVAGNGESAAAVARGAFRFPATGLCHGQPAGHLVLLPVVPAVRLEAAIFHWRVAGAAGAVRALAREGIGSLAED